MNEDIATLARTADDEIKPILRSRTIWALVITVLAYAANRAGAHVADTQVSGMIDLVTNVIQGGGITMAALGRVVATGPLK